MPRKSDINCIPKNPLPSAFYERKTELVAKDLLGKILCFQKTKQKILKARIVEVEAYLGATDRACHTFGYRKTERVKSMYLSGGHTYVYLIYGMYNCLNVVTRNGQEPEAVLIRALAPLEEHGQLAITTKPELNGPGKLCRAWGITRDQDGLALFDTESTLWIEDDGFQLKKSQLVKTPRIGVPYAQEALLWPLRFYLQGNPHVSRTR